MATKWKQASGALLAALGIGLMGAAHAAPIVDVVSGVWNIPRDGSYEYTHDLVNPEGYVPGTAIATATLSIRLRDNNGNETYTFTFGPGESHTFSTNINNSTPPFVFTLTAQSLAALTSTGTLGVTITADSCTSCTDYAFTFVSSTLKAEVAELSTAQAPAAVPEPGTLSLLGLGLAGLAALGRRRSTASAGRRG